MRELRKTAVKINMELDPKTRRMIPVEDVNDEKLEEALADYILEDFKGVGDEAGNVSSRHLKTEADNGSVTAQGFYLGCARALMLEKSK